MKTKLLVVGLLLCCFVVGLGATVQPQENKKWEYYFDNVVAQDRASQLGDEGWELVTTSPVKGSPGHFHVIYKRQRR